MMYSEIPDNEFKYRCGASIKYSAGIDNAEVIAIVDNKYHHRIYNLREEIRDNVEYKIWEDSRCSGSGIVYNKIYVFI